MSYTVKKKEWRTFHSCFCIFLTSHEVRWETWSVENVVMCPNIWKCLVSKSPKVQRVVSHTNFMVRRSGFYGDKYWGRSRQGNFNDSSSPSTFFNRQSFKWRQLWSVVWPILGRLSQYGKRLGLKLEMTLTDVNRISLVPCFRHRSLHTRLTFVSIVWKVTPLSIYK